MTCWVSVTDAESRALAKERQKKDNHNLSKWLMPSCCRSASPSNSHQTILFLMTFMLFISLNNSFYLRAPKPMQSQPGEREIHMTYRSLAPFNPKSCL